MEDPKITTEVKHSRSQKAWNVVSTRIGTKYKIARVPYLVIEGNQVANEIEKSEALKHAKFISHCFNNSTKIIYETTEI